MQLVRTLRFIVDHPLNRGARVAALLRFATWQVKSRLWRGPHIVPFVGDARLAVTGGMTGATGNIYCGLHEFADMAFVLHALRPGDLFVDAGANVGTYTVLAAKCAGADVVSFEPSPAAFDVLKRNVALNDISGRAELHQCALGAGSGVVAFTTDMDTGNHVAMDGETGSRSTVEMRSLDDVLRGRQPDVVKIDVEGFESDVLSGAARTLRSGRVRAVIMELNGSGARYGHTDAALHEMMTTSGFRAATYDPLTRTLLAAEHHGSFGNTIYVADMDDIAARLRLAPSFHVLGRQI